MNYTYIEKAELPEAKKLITYLNGVLTECRRLNRLTHMRPLWILGKKKAQARIEELNFKNQNK